MMTAEIKLFTNEQLAQLVANAIPDGSYLNLGIGLPTTVANYLAEDKEVILHTENGMLGMGPSPREGEEDDELINAGKQPVTIKAGGSFFHQADSFAMMRGGHLDYCVLGAYQVSIRGDIANWSTGKVDAIPAVGGAMDLAIGAKNIYVMMNLLTKQGESKLVSECTYPLTGIACIKRIYSDYGVFEISHQGVQVLAMPEGITLEKLQQITGLTLFTEQLAKR